MIYAQGLFPTKRLMRESNGYSILEAAGYVKTISPGCIALLPFGVLVLQNIIAAIHSICQKNGFWEISMPLLQRYELWEESGRASKYPGLLCETVVGNGKRYVINPTQEEAILDLFRSSKFTVNNLPLRLFHTGERVRNEIRPAFGLVRARSFMLTDIYALTTNELEYEKVAQQLERIMSAIFRWCNLPAKRGTYYPYAMDAVTYSY